MFIVNCSEIAGYKITDTKGLVSGSMVQSKHLGRDIMAGLKTLIGGEIVGYTEMLAEARQEAQNRMVKEAYSKNADAIINVRFTTSSIMQGMCELLVYGTAVKIEKIK